MFWITNEPQYLVTSMLQRLRGVSRIHKVSLRLPFVPLSLLFQLLHVCSRSHSHIRGYICSCIYSCSHPSTTLPISILILITVMVLDRSPLHVVNPHPVIYVPCRVRQRCRCLLPLIRLLSG